MSDRYRLLSQRDISSAGNTVIYTVPSPSSTDYGSVEVSPTSVSINTQTLVTSIVFSFVGSGVSITGDLTIKPNATDPAVNTISSIVLYDKQNSILPLVMPLPPGVSLNFNVSSYSSPGHLYITTFGIELETGYGPS